MYSATGCDGRAPQDDVSAHAAAARHPCFCILCRDLSERPRQLPVAEARRLCRQLGFSGLGIGHLGARTAQQPRERDEVAHRSVELIVACVAGLRGVDDDDGAARSGRLLLAH